MHAPLVTAIVSTYNSERFMKGCLEDLLSQTIASDVEIIVIDSGSQQNEGAVCQEFIKRHSNVRYFRTEREGLYVAWNRAVSLARGKYLTNANTDDRHRPDAFERLVGDLDNSSDSVLAYGDQLISTIENETFETCSSHQPNNFPLPEFSHGELLLGCITGSQPMWRSSVHSKHGMFNPDYRIASDFDFWLRIAQTGNFSHIAEPLGVFYRSKDTLSGTNNRWPCDLETLEIQLKYLALEPWRSDSQIPKKLAKTLFLKGYHYVEIERDTQRAKPFLFHAWKLDPINMSLAKTFILRGLIGSKWGLE